MSFTLSQNKRLFSLQSPFPAEGTIVRSLEGDEGISKLFNLKIQLISEDPELDPDKILGKKVCIGIRQSDGTSFRRFHGHVSKFWQDEPEERYFIYYANVVPWPWFLTLTKDCRIYQDKNVPDVLKDVFDRLGFTDYDFSGLRLNHAPWEYCLQYRETAFDFVSRLMEMEGIYYWFKHEADRHVLMLGDHMSSAQDLPYQSEFRWERSEGIGVQHGEDSIWDWVPRLSVRSGKYTHDEFHFQKPKPRGKDLMRVTTETGKSSGADKRFEVYDFPGEFEERSEGEDYGSYRQQELEVDQHEIEGKSNCRAFTPGYKIKLIEHIQNKQNDGYLITRVSHSAHEGSVYFGDPEGGAKYENYFHCIPAKTQYRPKRTTKKHQMRGIQSGIVTGPGGEEIYCDSYGRVKVQFNWDRIGQYNENSSCWLRVMQPWAGANWGQIWVPRIGQEVVIGFFEGDPDRPLVIGGLYNEDSPPPYGLPGNQTRMGVKTRSSKGGGPDNFNEFRLEDKKGDELVLLHAERDMDVSVERNKNEKVDENRTELVGKNHTEKVEQDYHLTVKGKRAVKIDGKDSLVAGGDIHIKSSGKIILDAATEIHLNAGTKVVMNAGMGVTMKGAGGFLQAGPSGVTIQGTMVLINSGGAPDVGSPVSPDAPDDPQLPNPMPRE
ncbi:MAG: type VI secretion system tip protein TssI/VgrG [Bryobacterales bacterium]